MQIQLLHIVYSYIYIYRDCLPLGIYLSQLCALTYVFISIASSNIIYDISIVSPLQIYLSQLSPLTYIYIYLNCLLLHIFISITSPQTRHEFFANKFYLSQNPAALHCLDHWLYTRTLAGHTIDMTYYTQLPFVKHRANSTSTHKVNLRT